MLEIFTFSITDGEKFPDKADSNSFDLNTQLEAPVILTLTSFFNLGDQGISVDEKTKI